MIIFPKLSSDTLGVPSDLTGGQTGQFCQIGQFGPINLFNFPYTKKRKMAGQQKGRSDEL